MFFRFRFIMYLVLALLKVALVNFTLNEYVMMALPSVEVTAISLVCSNLYLVTCVLCMVMAGCW